MESNKDKSLIPPGPYCYTWIEVPSKNNNFRVKVKMCPYWKPKTIEGIQVPWCDYLELGGTPGCGKWEGWENYKKADKILAKHFGGEEKRDKKLCLSLLFDQCKECGENDSEDFENYGK